MRNIKIFAVGVAVAAVLTAGWVGIGSASAASDPVGVSTAAVAEPVTPGAGAAEPAKPGAGAAEPAKPGAGAAEPAKPGAGAAEPAKPGAGAAEPAKPGAPVAEHPGMAPLAAGTAFEHPTDLAEDRQEAGTVEQLDDPRDAGTSEAERLDAERRAAEGTLER